MIKNAIFCHNMLTRLVISKKHFTILYGGKAFRSDRFGYILSRYMIFCWWSWRLSDITELFTLFCNIYKEIQNKDESINASLAQSCISYIKQINFPNGGGIYISLKLIFRSQNIFVRTQTRITKWKILAYFGIQTTKLPLTKRPR